MTRVWPLPKIYLFQKIKLTQKIAAPAGNRHFMAVHHFGQCKMMPKTRNRVSPIAPREIATDSSRKNHGFSLFLSFLAERKPKMAAVKTNKKDIESRIKTASRSILASFVKTTIRQ